MTSNRIFASGAFTNIAALALAVAATATTISTVRAEPGTADFRASVASSIDGTLRLPRGRNDFRKGIATIAVTVDAKGRVEAADLVRSSGVGAFDREALRTARAVSYPATGEPRIVAMVLGFNRPVNSEIQREARRDVVAWRDDRRVMLAKGIAAQQPDS